ncbi:1,2-phenylacetyl-CoA epoxidase subunit PaaE [Arthrobacter psychrochitiniphilus]|uniref:Phenylacetate-CoA oxygenase/reductase subunit PaaK n=1 Tax=Arthrobacter psychrochitiniphilus TaxID=291045 RepID=A0A2V3DTE8_9MICC|nr:1,2-phenylacetyl-CoA epoxidase subunit PaaE [Arthrobacter psychrochitiniphilus]NYG18882.1 ring-1,2-phenylacetyl-CoA epoxidase subunit PaaE [Arthrobacter psychrochitiniphilus]PXA66214.1 phenylacetate-CoA oxygenase/reductase subunit PaaK [Arthrobacter psychrochitiniphilus]
MSIPANATARRRASFHTLTVTEVRRLTEDAIEVTFTVPAKLAGHYDYLPGQYVALRLKMRDEAGVLRELRRSYSLCAVPVQFPDGSSELKVAIKRDIGGQFSTWANAELAAGEVIEVMSPQGAFVSRHAGAAVNGGVNILNSMNHPEELARHAGNYVAIAAGSGITPVMALAKSLLASNNETRLDLVYANKAAMDVMFLEDLADLKDRYPGRFALHHVLSREQRISPLLSGRLDAVKLETLLDTAIHADGVDEWFLCGPFDLVQLCRDVLAARGVPRDAIRFELFTTGSPDRPAGQHGRPVLIDSSEETWKLTFTLDGLRAELRSPVHARESLLNAALRVRPDVPFACAGGVCGTCRAKLVSGDVTMDENYALEPDELEAGYILTCQSHPTTPEVTVDYDG